LTHIYHGEKVLVVKVFLSVLMLIFSLQSLSKANDIKDLEIEGMSIGDSLLNYFNEQDILSAKQNTQYPNDKFIVYSLHKIKSLEIYDGLNVSIKKNNKKYELSHIQAIIWYKKENEFEKCNDKKKEIENRLSDIFNGLEREEKKYLSSYDNKSPVNGVQYYFDSGEVIAINCNDWMKETGLTKNLDVAITTKEFFIFVTEEAFNQ